MSTTTDSPADEYGFRALTAALILLLTLQFLGWSSVPASVVTGAALAASLWWVHRRPELFWFGVVLLFVALGGGWWLTERGLMSAGGSPFHAPFFLFLATTSLARVMQSAHAGEDALLGSACAYVLLGLVFASTYEAVEFFSPGAIAGLDPSGANGTVFAQLTYFSLVTLTTLGYGDLAPTHPFCESLAVVESVAGVLFPALIVARIIGGRSAHWAATRGRRETEEARESRVVLGLFVFLPVIVLALPWVGGTKWGGVAIAGLLLSMTVLGVYFISGRKQVLVVGLGISFVACALRLLGGDRVVFAVVLEVALIGTVVARMSLWFVRRSEATTSVILAAACIYWMIGIGFADAYGLVAHFFPDAIAGSSDRPFAPMLYFSFMTLTTTGYGDFTPVISLSRSLASLEAFLGVFYPAIVISKLVSLYGRPG